MNKDDIIRMAREAGFFVKDAEAYIPSIQYDHELTPYLELFYKLVAAHEREACAKVVQDHPFWLGNKAKQEITAAIRGTT